MNKCIDLKDLQEFDAADYLDSDAAIIAYLSEILKLEDVELLKVALNDVSRARGMTCPPFDIHQVTAANSAAMLQRICLSFGIEKPEVV